MAKYHVGAAVKYWRKRSRISQTKLAEMLGLNSHASVVAIEKNEQRVSDEQIETLERIFRARTGEAVSLLGWQSDEMVHETSTDCRSPEGVTVGLVDSIITMCRLLKTRDLHPDAVQHALADLCADKDFRRLRHAAVKARLAIRKASEE